VFDVVVFSAAAAAAAAGRGGKLFGPEGDVCWGGNTNDKPPGNNSAKISALFMVLPRANDSCCPNKGFGSDSVVESILRLWLFVLVGFGLLEGPN